MKVKNIIFFPIALAVALYRLANQKTYYITGTGISNLTGERIWFKTVFHTHTDVLPLQSMEDKMKEEMDLKRCIIVFFQRIPNRMGKHVHEPIELEITQIKEPK